MLKEFLVMICCTIVVGIITVKSGDDEDDKIRED